MDSPSEYWENPIHGLGHLDLSDRRSFALDVGGVVGQVPVATRDGRHHRRPANPGTARGLGNVTATRPPRVDGGGIV